MANNFKLTGSRYISKAGHDSNDGLTPDTPKKSISDASISYTAGETTVIGAGHYIGGSVSSTNKSHKIRGDGKVILDSIGWATSNYFHGNHPGINIEFRNMTVICRQGYIGDIIAKNCSLRPYISSSYTLNAIVISSEFFEVGGDYMGSKFSILIGCTGLIHNLEDSYIDQNTILTETAGTTTLKDCNFRGVLKLQMTDATYKSFAIQGELTGTPQDNGYASDVYWLNQTNIDALGGYTGGLNITQAVNTCINKDPLFNDESSEDFSLQAGSPHIGRASDGTNIGGTKVSVSVFNSDNGLGNTEVIASAEVNTATNAYTVASGQEEGYIDYITKIGDSNLVLKEIFPITSLEFDSDTVGGNIGNQNVPDSEPLSIEYPRTLTTTSDAPDASTLNVTAHDVQVGEYIRLDGQAREVTAITADTITLATALRAIPLSGTAFKVSQKVRIGALNPNRLTFMMRTSKENNKPVQDSDWDNDIDPIYNKTGAFLTQEWGEIPGYYIDTQTNDVWGSGDAETPQGLTKNEISCKWIHIRVYIRNNYES